ncbi:beta-glucosidase 24-like [Mercurialis annua]|uniref:beta-glucosidase 24-like n=1 Tax=Mercurialis annua TaxID=3986 RepID=UPI00215E04D0|nr:beta-glucosidase 24-like [Mercurialis annua]
MHGLNKLIFKMANSLSLNTLPAIALLLATILFLIHGTESIQSAKRSDFPKDFLFGAATSAVQIEGASSSDGKGPSIWDYYQGNKKVLVLDGSNMFTAIDSYNRYWEDLEHLKNLGGNGHRFSISWSRILPKGSLSGGVNQKAVDHYNYFINRLLEYGITPLVTLYHFDIPEALQDKYGGFLSNSIVNDFKDYAEVCFQKFGDRVKHWITINEPLVVTQLGYDIGLSPPLRCSDRKMCAAGDSAKEPYIVTHNLLLSHTAAARLYKDKYQATQKGEIGITLVGQYYEPSSQSAEDIAAQQRALDFNLGWFVCPLVYGDYPDSMKQIVKGRLPYFSDQEKMLVKGAYDFIGINYYTSLYTKNIPVDLNAAPVSYSRDQFVNTSVRSSTGALIGPRAEGFADLYVYPQGLQGVLEYLKNRYKNPKIIITENGVTEKRDDNRPLAQALNDQHRISYIQQHLDHVHYAIQNGVNVKGYFYWSAFDSFEWYGGYTTRYGFYYIDYKQNLKRIPKASVAWFQHFMNGSSAQQCKAKTGGH